MEGQRSVKKYALSEEEKEETGRRLKFMCPETSVNEGLQYLKTVSAAESIMEEWASFRLIGGPGMTNGVLQ